MHLGRIIAQVVKLHNVATRPGDMNQLVAAIEGGRPLAGRAGYVEARVFRVDQLIVALSEHRAASRSGPDRRPPGCTGRGDEEGSPVGSLQAINAEEGDDGRRDVDVFRQRVDARPRRDTSRKADDERDVQGFTCSTRAITSCWCSIGGATWPAPCARR